MKKKKDIKDILGIVILILLVVFVYSLFNSTGIKAQADEYKPDPTKSRADNLVAHYGKYLLEIEKRKELFDSSFMIELADWVQKEINEGEYTKGDKTKLVNLLIEIKKAQTTEQKRILRAQAKELLRKIKQDKAKKQGYKERLKELEKTINKAIKDAPNE